MKLLTEEEFCYLDTQFNGEEIDNIKQAVQRSFTGKELLEFINFCIKMKNENNTKKTKN